MKKVLNNYRDWIKKQILDNYDNNYDEVKDLSHWRNQIFANILMIMLPVGIIIYFPNIMISINSDSIMIALADTIALFLLLAIVFIKSITLKYKKILFISGLYLLSATLLYYLGSNGPGLIYLMSVSIFIIVVYNNKLAYYSILINAILSGLPMLAYKVGDYDSMFFEGYGYAALLAFASNSIMLNSVVVVAVSALFNGLQKSLRNEINLKESLKIESKNLEIAKLKAEESDRLKSAFLANMSHEIRTPMNGIMGFTELLSDENLTPFEKNEYVDCIKKSCYRLMNLINDLIDISKIETQQMQLEFSKTKVHNVCLEIYKNFKKSADEKGLEMIYENFENDSIHIKTDENRLLQILNNLVNNAIKYTDKGYVKFGFHTLNDEIHFYVIDSGIGIKDSDFQRIFKRFERLNNELNSNYEGSGLGLSISDSLAKLLNGRIMLHSEKDKGSKFTLVLPINNS